MLRMPPGFTTNYRAWGRPPMVLPRQNITYNYAPCDHSSSGLSSAGKWALGIGAGIGLLPMILGWFGIGGGGGGRRAAAQEQAAQQAAQQTAEQQATLTNLQTIYSNYNWIIQDGQFMAYDKTTNKCVAAGTSFTQVKEAMEQIAGQDTGRQQVAGFTKAEALEIITNMGLADKITITDDGKIQYTGADGQPVTAELTTANLGKAVQIVKDAGSAVVQDDPVKKFNENTNVTAKNASIAKNGDKYTLTINNADGSKTIYECASIEEAYTKLGLNADGTPIQKGGGQGGGTRIKVPSDWPLVTEADLLSQESFPGSNRSLNPENLTIINKHTQGYMTCSNATEVYELLVAKASFNNKTIKGKSSDVIADIIKYNPSIFDSTGKVKAGAKWERLNLPTGVKKQSAASSAQQVSPPTLTCKLTAFSYPTGQSASVTITVNGTSYSAKAREFKHETTKQNLIDELFNKVKNDFPNIQKAEIEKLLNRCNFDHPQQTKTDTK